MGHPKIKRPPEFSVIAWCFCTWALLGSYSLLLMGNASASLFVSNLIFDVLLPLGSGIGLLRSSRWGWILATGYSLGLLLIYLLSIARYFLSRAEFSNIANEFSGLGELISQLWLPILLCLCSYLLLMHPRNRRFLKLDEAGSKRWYPYQVCLALALVSLNLLLNAILVFNR